MKTVKKISAFLGGLSLLAYSALPAFAQAPPPGPGEIGINPCPQDSGGFFKLCNDFRADNIGSIVGNVLTILLVAAVIIALFFLIYGGIRWITSGGDKAKVESARSHVIAAIVGLIIAFVAYFIVQIILSIFGIASLQELRVPTLTP